MRKSAKKIANEMVALIENSGLHDLLECSPEVEQYHFKGAASIYHDSILIMVHPCKGGVRFSPVPPPDDKHLVPKGALEGFTEPLDFDPRKVSIRIRKLCRSVRSTFTDLGVTAHLYEDDEFDVDGFVTIGGKKYQDALDEINALEDIWVELEDEFNPDEGEFNPDEGEGWKNGTSNL